MRKGLIRLALFLVGIAIPAAQTSSYPPPGQWARKAPGEVGMDPARLNDALEFMKMHETASPARDFSDQEIVNGKLLASMPTERAATNGLIIRRRYKEATTPSPHGPDYGLLWWLNTKQAQWPGFPANAFSARGQGGNIIFISPSHDLLVVWRWSGQANEGFRRIVASITS